ncbi:MAG: LD-carboxypeptidase [Chitinophagaceae bacterium]|nr:LD-carboxypeptidase [Chitinophagaceae bacterium]
MIKIPPYLKPGDTIGIVCPAGYMARQKAQTCIDVLEQWGYKVKTGKTLGGSSENYFSGTDEERLNDFQRMLDDDKVKAVLCGRGGYGLSRIIDKIDFKKFRKTPKWLIGFSDVTVLHAHVFSNYKIVTLHAPMAAAFNNEGHKNEYVLSLKNALEGKKAKYSCSVHPFNHPGKAEGQLVGGNLSLLVHLTGTVSETDTKGKILFIEDTGEYLYKIDRMMQQLKRNGKLEKLSGLVIGRFSDSSDTERPFGKTVEEIIHDTVKEYKYPVCYGFPVSHEKENYALKHGVQYTLKINREKVTLHE